MEEESYRVFICLILGLLLLVDKGVRERVLGVWSVVILRDWGRFYLLLDFCIVFKLYNLAVKYAMDDG